MVKKYGFMALVLLSLAGCQQGGAVKRAPKKAESNTRYDLLNRGYSIDYVDAYELGCNSVEDANIVVDQSRYNSSTEYKRGWRQGVATCKNPYGSISRQVIEQKKRTSTDSQLWNEMKK